MDGVSRKRKRSPSLLSVQEASKHVHLIPQLITRLYGRYRDHVIRDIREDERRYGLLLQEIEDISGGKWDEQLVRQDGLKTRASSHPLGASPSHTSPHRGSKYDSAQQGAQNSSSVSVASPPAPPPPAATEPQTAPREPNLTQAKIDSVINHPLDAPKSEDAVPTDPGPPVLPSPQQFPTQLGALTQPATPAARLPLPRPSNSGYRLNSPSVHQSPYAPSPSPHVPGAAISPASDGQPSSASPVVLPPPPGMTYFSPPAQSGPSYPGAASYSPPQHGQTAPRYPPAPLASHENQQPYPYPPNQYPQYSGRAPIPSHQGGVMLPPFQLDLQSSGRTNYTQHLSPSSATATPSRAQATATPSHATADMPEQSPLSAQHIQSQREEIVRIAGMLSNQPPTPAYTWKKLSRVSKLVIPGSPTRPPIEALSPVKQRRLSLEPEVRGSKPKRQSRARATSPANEDRTSIAEQPSDGTSQPKPVRTRNRKARGGSVSSSAVASSIRGRTRSQSVISHAESSAQDNEQSSQPPVKPEPPSTPAGSGALSDIAASESTPTDTRVTRRRAGTLQSAPDAPGKRKRPVKELSESSPPTEIPASNPERQCIVASRNFQRTSLTIMNDITSHKYASYFAQPVTERQAEGYHDIIHRGQDLRTIRGLINTGSKVIGSMTSVNGTSLDVSQSSLASPGGPSGVGSVVVPAHPSTMPPNAIVNSSQLEKEIMRMFANAVMFNPGDEGMVKDAREMAEDVQGMVRHWRGAEGTQTGTPVHTGARGKADEEDEIGEEAVGKKRKL